MKPGRNDPCPCGSGKKYKKCHGAAEQVKPLDASVVALNDVTTDALDLMKRWVVIVRSVTSEIAKMERTKTSGRSKKDAAVSRWVIYLGVMLAQVAEAIADLAPGHNVRAMVVLVRSMFEYQQKAQYFLNHEKDAFEQVASIVARRFSALSKLSHPNPRIGVLLATEYLEWKRTSGVRDEWSGNKRVPTMHLENTEPSKIKTDKNGDKYTEEFQTAYGVPSFYVHGEPILMPEVFPKLADDSNWEVRESPVYFDSLTTVNAANVHLSNYCIKTTAAYKLDFGRISALGPQIARVLKASVTVHGFQLRVVPAKTTSREVRTTS